MFYQYTLYNQLLLQQKIRLIFSKDKQHQHQGLQKNYRWHRQQQNLYELQL